MAEAPDRASLVKVRAVLLDAETLVLQWLNEAASLALLDTPQLGTRVTETQLAAITGTREALALVESVAQTGEPRHISVDLVSTGRGSVTVVTAVYMLPGRGVLVLTENSWKGKAVDHDASSSRRSPRPGR